MTWHASLNLNYTLQDRRSVLHFAHSGPLRVLKSLYPEGDGVCHNVLVHPPSGLVGGDTLAIHAQLASGCHALVTTPGATRFYRSASELAVQRTHLRLQAGARMDWLPLETIAYSGCRAENHLCMELEPGAELLGWDVSTLGLLHARQDFEQGSYLQHIEIPGVWLERGVIDASDTRLLQSPTGLAGQRCIGTVFFACGHALDRERRAWALECARETIGTHPLQSTAGASSPNPQVVVVRVLGNQTESVMDLLKNVWANWRQGLWQMGAMVPRIWAM